MRCVAAKELVPSKAAGEIGRCCRLPVARAFLSLPLPLLRRADWLAAHLCSDLAQRYRRSVLTRSLQYPNVHTPGKIPRFESSEVVAPVSFPSVDIHIINQNSGDSFAHPLFEESCWDPIKGWHVTGLGYRGLSSGTGGRDCSCP